MQLVALACLLSVCTPTWSLTYLQPVRIETTILEEQAKALTRKLAENDCQNNVNSKRDLANRDPETINWEILEIHVNDLQRKWIACERALHSSTVTPSTMNSSSSTMKPTVTTSVHFPTEEPIVTTIQPSADNGSASTSMQTVPGSSALSRTSPSTTIQPTTPQSNSSLPTTTSPTTTPPTSTSPTSTLPTSSLPTTTQPTTTQPNSPLPTSTLPTTALPTTISPTSSLPTTTSPTSSLPTSTLPTTALPTTTSPTSSLPTTTSPTSPLPTTTSMPATTEPTTTATKPPTTRQPMTTKSPETHCAEAITITEPWRLYYNDGVITSGNADANTSSCDLHKNSKWFKFGGAAGVKMLDSCPKKNSCGSVSPVWTDDSMPKAILIPKVIDAYISMSSDEVSDCYSQSIEMEVIRCTWDTTHDFVFKYQGGDIADCNSAFCGMIP